ncbi:DUF934 domain-containing protein [Phaeobacter sp. 11ANDIMAR09]|uniref:DUF934 domain-containing protein n=1 Tax=Phaeobacter sp. 11ANDIMAR09 TaxID=1225647 RepID=UPI0006C84378|nr:DUF934 domain-containing protein [Phaeobacter sp. 11ANDIMAR09]KPD12616.1 putative oxidoreductase [Phaeobacter sp. 11ANDIMAR09]OIQ34647.1 MAG: oxidoreductase [Roseobacter sp. MedPE-SWchi]
MTVIVSDAGFGPETWAAGFEGETALDLASDTDPASLGSQLAGVEMIRIDFPSFADGRGFTLARQLRLMGYTGRLRAKGHVLADQYAMARRTGFDEVEISDDLATRQPQEQWLARAQWGAHNYQARLRGGSAAG